MNLNPEFQRQLNLECSQAHLIGIPLALGTLFTLGYFIDGHRLGSITAKAALTLFLFVTLLWGARKALNSIIEEYRDRTWDTQRLSALGPWEMTWGKLFGSTAMVWYAGIICLFVYSLAAGQRAGLPSTIFYGIAAALLLQSGSLLLGLLAVYRGQNKNDALFVVSIIVFFLLVPWLMETPDSVGYPGQQSITQWYGRPIDQAWLNQCNLLVALFWCMVGSYRMMAQALGLRTLPWVWFCFLIFSVIYLGGFLSGSSYWFSLTALLVCSTLTYAGILYERNDAIRIKHFMGYFALGNWRRAGEEMPVWWLSFIMMLPAALSLAFSNHPMHEFGTMFHFYPLAVVLIVLRDCAIYLYFVYSKKPERALSMTLLVAVFLYGILPGLFGFIGVRGLSTLAFPLWADTAANALICALLQCAIVLKLLYYRWKSQT